MNVGSELMGNGVALAAGGNKTEDLAWTWRPVREMQGLREGIGC